MRKSIKVAPGVRMTFSKSGVSYSGGVKGYRVTRRADGRMQSTASPPGTGMSYTSTSGRSSRSEPPPAPKLKPVKPGMFAPKAEKELYAAVEARDVNAVERVGQTYGDTHGLAAATIAAVLHLTREGGNHRARQLLEWVFATGKDPAADPLVSKYVTMRYQLPVVPGATANLGPDRSAVGLMLAELRQVAGDLAGAIDVVEQLEPTTFAALSLAELYCEAGRYRDVVGLTDGIRNEDDSTALLCVFRGIAFREQELFEAAREAFKEALKSKKVDSTVRHRALLERARCYEAEGKRGMAKKDLERILAEDSRYEGLQQAMDDLG